MTLPDEVVKAIEELHQPVELLAVERLCLLTQRLTIEECAKVCDEILARARPMCEANYTDGDSWVATCASAIRELEGKESDVSDTVRVPREPTKEMLEAIEGHFRKWQKIIPGISDDDVKADSWSALQAYRAMLSAAPQSSDGWIPVGERLPKIGVPEIDGPCDGTSVLFLHDGSVYTGWPVYPPDQWEMSEGGLGIFSGVTHWMPFPSPPEKDKP